MKRDPNTSAVPDHRKASRKGLVVTALALLALAAGWHWLGGGHDLRHYQGATMGTTWSLTIDARALDEEHRARLDHIEELALSHFRHIDRLFSTWRTDSEISRLNRGQSLDSLDAELAKVLGFALDAQRANPEFLDFRLQDTLERLGFELPPEALPREPSAMALTAKDAAQTGNSPATALVASPKSALLPPNAIAGAGESSSSHESSFQGDMPSAGNTGKGDLRSSMPAPGYNLSAIVKGHAVDGLSQALAARGYADTLVELGGEIYARCQRRRQPWRIAIQDPRWPARPAPIETIEVCNHAVATSGDYNKFIERDGVRAGHLIDPARAAPKDNPTRSVTVLAASAMVADAFATAFAVSGLARAGEVAPSEPLRALFIVEPEPGQLDLIWRDFAPSDSSAP